MSTGSGPTAFRLSNRYYGLLAVALGLVLLGTAVAGQLVNRISSNPTEATDFSSIPASVSFSAPSLSLQDLNGKLHSLSDYRGDVVLVNLWATWCPPCQAEMPVLQSYYLAHQSAGFTVIGVEDGDPASQVSSFAAKYGLTFPIWLDPGYQATDQAFRTADLPTSYVINRDGQVRLMWIGAISEANLEKYVTPIIQE